MKYSDPHAPEETRLNLIRAAVVKEQKDAPTIFTLGHLLAALLLLVIVLALGRFGIL